MKNSEIIKADRPPLDIQPYVENLDVKPIGEPSAPITKISQSTLATIATKTLKTAQSYRSTDKPKDAARWARVGTIGAGLFALLAILPPLPNESARVNHIRTILSPIATLAALAATKEHTETYAKELQKIRKDKAGRHQRALKAIDAIHDPASVESFIEVGEKPRIILNILNADPSLLQAEFAGQKQWATFTRYYFFLAHSRASIGQLGLEKKIKEAIGTKEAVSLDLSEGALCVDISLPLNQCSYPKVRDYLGTDRYEVLIPIGISGDRLLTVPFDSSFNGGWTNGMSGAGKSVWAISVMQYLGCRHRSSVIQYSGGEALFGAKAETFRDADFANDPHLFCPFAKDFAGILQALAKIIYECRRRSALFNEVGVQNIDEWNAGGYGEYLPKILYFIDEPESIFDQQICSPLYYRALLRQMLFIGRMCRSQGAALVLLPKSVAAGEQEIFPPGLRRTMGSLAVCLKALAADGCITLQASEEEESIARTVAHLPGRGAGFARVDGVIQRIQSLYADKPISQMPIAGKGIDRMPDQTMPNLIEVLAEFTSTQQSTEDVSLVRALEEEGISMAGLVAILKGEVSLDELRLEQTRRMKMVCQSEVDASQLVAAGEV
jgi:hypothetical protein